MQGTWAISGVDLHVEFRRSQLRRRLEQAMREAVIDGRLRQGVRLPSSRTLAADLGVARNTIAEVYGQLSAEGWLTAKVGSGTYVAARPAAAAPALAASVPAASASRFDLAAGSPDLSSFPRAQWLSAARRALGAAPDDALGYGDHRGRPELRAALADYLGRARGVHADPERIVVCAGFGQALDCLCAVLRRRGARTVLTEAYGLTSNPDTIGRHGLALRTMAVDRHGAAMGSALDNADAVLLTPAHQFPLGEVLAAERRAEVVGWAARTGGLVIEDDYDGEFRYDRQAVGALQALAPEHVVYAGTASKTLAPGLRLAWLVVPGQLVGELGELTSAPGAHTSALEQLTLAELIRSGAYDRHVRRCRLVYRRRRDHLLAALHRDAPGCQITGAAAGLHAVVRLPSGRSEARTVERAAEHGVTARGLSDFALGEQSQSPALVVGYARPPAHAFTTAVARLCAAIGPHHRPASA